MADKSKIKWAAVTAIVDRGGARVRLYRRKNAFRPGQRVRKEKFADGFKWCRGCQEWLPLALVGKNGLCRPHENEYARNLYNSNPGTRAKRQAHSYERKRGVKKMPDFAAELISELFDGECAYCNNRATTWEHVIAVSKGGKTDPGNMVPACRPCNSAKHDSDIDAWLDRAPVIKPYTIEYLSLSFAGLL